MQSGRNRFTADGEEAFLPNSTSRTEALFAFEELARGTVTWQAGGRLERARIAADGHRARGETTFSGALGAVWHVTDQVSLIANRSSNQGVPSFTRNVKLSVPVASALALYTRFGAVPLSVPCFGCDTTV